MNVSLTEKQKRYIASQIETGDYQNASELVRDALRLHEVYRKKIIEDLRTEIEKGWNSPATDLTATQIAEKKLKDYRD
jgi:antitoxin ParD1/3/4